MEKEFNKLHKSILSPTDIIKHIHKSDNKILKQIVDNIIPELKKNNINLYFALVARMGFKNANI